MSTDSLENLKQDLRNFAAERDWDQFHSPKNLACAITTEAAELLAHFRWSGEGEQALSDQQRIKISHEIADVLLFLIRLADKLSIDPLVAAKEKLKLNAMRYPVDKAKGSNKKYTEF